MEQLLRVIILLLVAQFYCADMTKLEGTTEGPSEYCYQDVFFEPRCDSSEVIMVQTAHYGRMRKGRCITDDLGSIGCSVDTLGLLDMKCSGRRTCQVAVAQLEQEITSPCPNGMKMYLELGYECFKVVYPSRGYCDSGKPTNIPGEHGYLSSLTTQETGCGSMDSPWMITAKPGKQFRIRLWNFDYANTKSRVNSEECDIYVLLGESKIGSSEKLCAGDTRESPEYTSVTNIVELRLIKGRKGYNSDQHIVVEYQAFGCADMAPPKNGWIQRVGVQLYLGCNGTDENAHRWKMYCNDSHWTGPEHNCSIAHTTTTPVTEQLTTEKRVQDRALIRVTSTMSIIVITGLAVLVCLCIALSSMAIYIVRYRRRERQVPEQGSSPNCNTQNRRLATGTRHSLMKADALDGSAIEPDQYWTWQQQRGDSCPHDPDDTNRSQVGTMTSRASRQAPEESTMLVRKVEDRRSHLGAGRRVPDYDQLVSGFMESVCADTNPENM